ncbi:MAG: GNAT family N-acetyltransferase [Pseudomonadales bacterium]|nr:GNAT family N-acetyltransferase [Pseudomonadales bacterium]
MTQASIQIRRAGADDARVILDFILELADYEKLPHEVLASEEDIRRTLLGPQAKARALLCCIDAVAVGYAVYFFNYSTWLGKNGIYLEDLYVTPAFRGCGAGKALFRHVAKIALENNCGRYEWSVLNWNTPAIDFYESLGAKPMSEWTQYRIAGEALTQLARN